MRMRGVKFISVHHAYYVDLRMRLEAMGTAVVKDFDQLEDENILMDFNEDGYLLQTYTKTLDGSADRLP